MCRGIIALTLLVLAANGCAFDRGGLPVSPLSDSDGGVLTLAFPDAGANTESDGGPVPPPGSPTPTTPGSGSGLITLCHVPPSTPKTLLVEPSAVPGHLSHGDFLGPCPPPVH